MTGVRNPAIEIERLTRDFGATRAVDDISLQVPQGSVFGFLGPNGAGKSTTLGILTGLDKPTSGTARILGYDVVRQADEVHRVIGYLPDVPAFYSWMTAREVLDLAGRLHQIPGDIRAQRIDIVLDLCGLAGIETKVGGYSRGMRQRLGVAQALIDAPSVLLLDEPTSALDPIGRKDVLDIITALRGRTTVFFSSHILSDVERVCDQVAILDRGRVVLESTIGTIHARARSQRLFVQVGSGEEARRLDQALRDQPWVDTVSVDRESLNVTATDLEAAQRAIPGVIAGLGLTLRRLETAEPTLEEVFVDLVTGVGS
jgi:ABC-2 type transport system ATP-binding protein